MKSGRYKRSWTAKKTKENSHTLEMTVHSKDRYQIALRIPEIAFHTVEITLEMVSMLGEISA